MDELSVVHVAPHLAQGGAERVLHLVLTHPEPATRHSLVLMEDDVFFDCDGIDVSSLGFDFSSRGGSLARLVPAMRALRRRVLEVRPDVVVGWLYYGALLTTALTRSGVPVVWSIHNTTFPSFSSNPVLHTVDRILAVSSHKVPASVIYCADSARSLHEHHGYAAAKGVVVANGVDTTRYCADQTARACARSSLGLGASDYGVVLCARFDAQKNVAGALDAFALFRRDANNAVLLLAGRGMEEGNSALSELIEARGLSQSCRRLGALRDTVPLMRAADVVMLASTYGEAMPMVLLEALATGTPIAATRVGDVGALPVPQGSLAEPGDARALAGALDFARKTSDAAAWQETYSTVRSTFSLGRCVAGYASVLRSAARGRSNAEVRR